MVFEELDTIIINTIYIDNSGRMYSTVKITIPTQYFKVHFRKIS